MKLRIEIDMSNAAFEDAGNEAAWILRRLAREIDGADLEMNSSDKLLDSNGTSCGRVEVVE